MRASGGPAVVVPISDALLLVPPLPSPRRPDRQPAAACHNLLDEPPKQDTRGLEVVGRFEAQGKIGEVLEAWLRHHPRVLDPHAAQPYEVQARLDSDHV